MKIDAEIHISKDYDIDIKVLHNGRGFKKFMLMESIVVYIYIGEDCVRKVCIPVGFLMDGRSSPGFLKWLFPTWGKGAIAWITHDYLYNTRWGHDEYGPELARKISDRVMLVLSDTLNPAGKYFNYLSYLYVRLIGWVVYKRRR
jgi:hypothetical protein